MISNPNTRPKSAGTGLKAPVNSETSAHLPTDTMSFATKIISLLITGPKIVNNSTNKVSVNTEVDASLSTLK